MKSNLSSTFENLEHRLLNSPRLDRILVPTDFSPLSICGIEAAVSLLAGNSNASLTLVHVIEPLPAMEFVEAGMFVSSGIDLLRKSAEEELARLRLKYGEGIQLATHVLIGNPVWAISALVNDEEFDLVVITSHGRSGFKRLFLGSVAEGIVHRAHGPVLVIKQPRDVQGDFDSENPKVTWKKLLVGYDHRPGAVAALGMAEKISERCDATIELMNVVPPTDARLAINVLHEDRDNKVSVAEAIERLETVKLSYSPLSVGWKVSARVGNPWDVLSEMAGEISADMIVVGPHEHTHQAKHFLGSTAQRLVRLSPCSVLAVK